MIWWFVFITLTVIAALVTVRLVPAEHRWNYTHCPKDWLYWTAGLSSLSIWAVAAVQSVVAPSEMALWVRIVGAVYVVGGHALQIWAWRVNFFLLPSVVYIPPDLRATNGPYRFVTHPFYLGITTTATGTVCLLGQWWALFPLAAYLGLIQYRVHIEDRILNQQPQ
jgi:protein-S-isoprenylcysteine O-methyltransferase Ste14